MSIKTKSIKSSLLMDWMPNSPIEKNILAKRAELLKTKVIPALQQESSDHYVRFRVGKEYFGIPFQHIKEVMLNSTSTQVPHAPPYIVGVINRHGKLLSILDLKVFFNMNTHSADDHNSLVSSSYLLIVTAAHITMAILADTVEGSKNYTLAHLNPPLMRHDAISSKYLLGLHQGQTAILNMDNVLLALQSTKTSLQENNP